MVSHRANQTERFYHGTLLEYIPSIKKQGLVGREGNFCENLIKKFGKGISEEDIQWTKNRCEDTAEGISVSGDYEYAVTQCRANLEAQVALEEAKLEAKYKKEHGIPDAGMISWEAALKIHRGYWRGLIKKHPCAVLTIDIPGGEKPIHTISDDMGLIGLTLSQQIDKNFEIQRKLAVNVPLSHQSRFPHTRKQSLGKLAEVRFMYIQPEWIIDVRRLSNKDANESWRNLDL